MTKHKATPEQWTASRYDWAHADTEAMDGDPAFRCTLELRARVEALEIWRATTETAGTDASIVGRRRWAAMSYRGVMLLPPIDCADPDLWIAERIYEMGFADGKIATTGDTAPVTRDRAKDVPASSDLLVERVAIICAMPAKWTWDDQARAVIHAIANWLDQQELHVAATRLRMEVGQ